MLSAERPQPSEALQGESFSCARFYGQAVPPTSNLKCLTAGQDSEHSRPALAFPRLRHGSGEMLQGFAFSQGKRGGMIARRRAIQLRFYDLVENGVTD